MQISSEQTDRRWVTAQKLRACQLLRVRIIGKQILVVFQAVNQWSGDFLANRRATMAAAEATGLFNKAFAGYFACG